MKLTNLSVLGRAAKAYGSGDLSTIAENALKLYPHAGHPFALSEEYPLPLHLFSPRLTAMLSSDDSRADARALWNLVTARENIIRMITATEIERTAAESLGKQLELRDWREFKTRNLSDEQKGIVMRRKQMLGYMIKVVMECFGYVVYQSRMIVDTNRDGGANVKRRTNYFSTAARYAPMSLKTRKALANQMETEEECAVFMSITDLILEGKTQYQKLYKIYDLSGGDSL
ncbi:MAG: hypothetical protein U1B83_01260 [Candidatus Cloacimonadaceae bacterium]|nr:hypothetical protein [Candidatus Cloacimonadaceae bacterium]